MSVVELVILGALFPCATAMGGPNSPIVETGTHQAKQLERGLFVGMSQRAAEKQLGEGPFCYAWFKASKGCTLRYRNAELIIEFNATGQFVGTRPWKLKSGQ